MDATDPLIVIAAERLLMLYLGAAVGYVAYRAAYKISRDDGFGITQALGTAAIVFVLAGAADNIGSLTLEAPALRPGDALTDYMPVTPEKRKDYAYVVGGLLLFPALYGFFKGTDERNRAVRLTQAIEPRHPH